MPSLASLAKAAMPRWWRFPVSLRSRTATLALAGLITLASFLIFRWAPNRQVGDSKYTILLAQNLVSHRDVYLERYQLEYPDYRIERLAGHDYYYFPAASSMFSAPYVAAMNLIGRSPLKSDGTYDPELEQNLDVLLARLLMAFFVALTFLTARQLLPTPASLAVTVVAGFGTQIFSTTSRALWSDTWGTLLIALTVFVLLRTEVSGRKPRAALVGGLVTAAYLVRPTNALPLAGVAVYMFWFHRRAFLSFVAGAAPLLAAFVLYSLLHFGTVLPSYHLAARTGFGSFTKALAANLISPSRGLLTCVPAVVGLAILLVRFRKSLRFNRLAILAIAISALHIVAISRFDTTGGHCFGPRLTASLVPWLALLGILALDAVHSAGEVNLERKGNQLGRFFLWGATAGLCLASIAINGIGAISASTARWNVMPLNIHAHPERIWDWRQPQFLAPFQPPPGPFPAFAAGSIRVGTSEADQHVGWDWSYGEGAYRWTDGHRAAIRFSLDAPGAGRLAFEAKPFLGEGKLSQQRVKIGFNGRLVQTWTLHAKEFARLELSIPADSVSRNNTIQFHLPDAASPRSLGQGGDRRRLGIAVRSVSWAPEGR